MPDVVILRGVSASGKTTFAKQEWTDEEVMQMARELVNQNGDF